jgi:hypothetical protein
MRAIVPRADGYVHALNRTPPNPAHAHRPLSRLRTTFRGGIGNPERVNAF